MSDGWHVHVIGTDILIPVRNHLGAVNLAHRLNRQIHSAMNTDGAEERMIYSWAVPVPQHSRTGREGMNGLASMEAELGGKAVAALSAIGKYRNRLGIEMEITGVLPECDDHPMTAKTIAGVIRGTFSTVIKGSGRESIHATPEQIETALAEAGYFHISSYHFDDKGEH